MLRIILLGIGIVAFILFVAWVFRDPIYLMLQDCDAEAQTHQAGMVSVCDVPRWRYKNK